MTIGKRYDYNEVVTILNNLGYVLISKEYINAKSYLHIIDKFGYKYSSTLDGLLSGKTPYFSDNRNIFFIDNIKNYILINKISCSLISDKYESKLKFKCKCGNIFMTSTNKFLNDNKIQCNCCSLVERGRKHRITLNEAINAFKSANLIPLFNKYTNINEKLMCKDKFGYYGNISLHSIRNGCSFEIVSKYNPYSIKNIYNYIKLNNLNCEIISKEFKNANTKLTFKCLCGREYKTSWRAFMTFHNDRCPKCSKKQSSYALKVENYLLKNNYKYEKEYKFSDCKDKSFLFFDFIIYIKNKFLLLEVDGETHFVPSWSGQEGLKLQQNRDKIKNEYCKKNNIKLIRVSYLEINDDTYLDKLKKELN